MTMMGIVFVTLPIRLVSLRDLRWHDHDISKDHLGDPHILREIDEVPIWCEQLVSGHWFVHDGRHRSIRALARGEHEIYAHALLNSYRRAPDEAQAPPEDRGQAERTQGTLF